MFWGSNKFGLFGEFWWVSPVMIITGALLWYLACQAQYQRKWRRLAPPLGLLGLALWFIPLFIPLF